MIRIEPYDPRWPENFASEADAIQRVAGDHLSALEHIGSTAVPGLAAKPLIDMMAALPDMEDADAVTNALTSLGYAIYPTDMEDRVVLQRGGQPGFNLHLVSEASWPHRTERLMRDALRGDPLASEAYGKLKTDLAALHGDNLPSYTRAKTDFIQALMDKVWQDLDMERRVLWAD